MKRPASIEEYLEQVGNGRASAFGRRFRRQFQDSRGTAELAMLAAPSEEEYADFCRLVAGMTEEEKANVGLLYAEEVRTVAQRCHADPGNAAIFLNGYALTQQRNRQKNDTRNE